VLRTLNLFEASGAWPEESAGRRAGRAAEGGTGIASTTGSRLLVGCFVLLLASAASNAVAQEEQPTDGMVIRRVEIVGLQAISEAYVRRLVKTREDQPFSRRQVEEDVRELLRSRKFLAVFATTRVEEGRAVVIFNVQEKPTIVSVELEGNKRFTDAELYELTPAAGAVLDLYEVNRARDDILQKYKQKGYYYATVTLDDVALETEGRVVYRITEGPRVKVRRILYEGNRSFSARRLGTRVESKTYIWIFRAGALDEEQAERDALAVQQFYRDEGFLDARVGYRLDFDPIQRANLDLVFVIEEGPRYQIKDFSFEGNSVFSDSRLRGVMRLAPDKFARDQVLREDVKRVQDLYGEIGYVAARIDTRYDFLEEPGLVILRYTIDEGTQSRIGRITIRGNRQTKDEVIRRELRFYPGEYYNTVEARKAEQRLRETALFKTDGVQIVPLEDVDGVRETLVTVEETETIQFLIGFGISTDSGVIGSLSVENRNFDLFDWPRSWGEFFRGRAFKGDGQRLLFQFEPGTEVTRFRISFTEPYLLDRPIRLDTSAYLFQRGREGYDEQRIGFSLALSKRFTGGLLNGWAVEGSMRLEGVSIDKVDPLSARDIREAKGDHTVLAFKGAIVRDTTDSRLMPTEGYRVSFGWEQAAPLAENYDFGKPVFSAAWYKTVRTDILDRKSVLAVRADAAYIVGDAPVFERYYGGGFGSLRGFSFRGISPRAGIKNQPVGGNFILLTGGEYSFPLYGKTFRGVLFLDMGTVEEGFEITSWRAAAGFGLRIQVDFFGPVPIVFDFGFPIAKQDDDNTRILNFAFGASF
jgi:outer membrane protein assembly complex protein YaeT